MPEGYVLDAGDLVVAMTEQAPGLLGSSGLVPAAGSWLHNQRIGRVGVRNASTSKRFIYYLLNAPSVRAQINRSATGTKVRHTAPERILAVRTPIPTLRTQHRVAAILRAFDDLIEINEQRIELLEGLTRSLYREWFVRFRFPGHETVDLVSSEVGPIPWGWDVGRLDDHLLLARGFDLPLSQRAEGLVPVVSASGVTGTHSIAKTSGPAVVTGRSGTIGRVTYVPSPCWPLNTTLWVKEFRLATPRTAYFLLESLRLDNHGGGAAVPTLNRNHIHGLPIVRSPTGLVATFDSVVTPMFELVEALFERNRTYRRTRDLLLPRLVTGRLDISDIDLGDLLPEAAAA